MFKIYWTGADHAACSQNASLLAKALELVKEKRDAGYSFVTMVAEDPNQVGKPGVDAVVNGKTPDGQDYDWSKAGRAGKPRKHDKVVTHKDH
ncbi:hypothetical protein [Hydrogenophaga sp. PAMC20947]|uniref:hypothetical protein n=1 Tax=Hydrogenophaga sp. PAMC20947 TaxID=2565558 RepID=UPI00109E2EEC|nr:hypothetical protein [Hydrogenophaga sp. PAMC20947]QCB44668.1 hypothetical protein E5678_00580 [Hydrogenophaga sp. PAMC20947]